MFHKYACIRLSFHPSVYAYIQTYIRTKTCKLIYIHRHLNDHFKLCYISVAKITQVINFCLKSNQDATFPCDTTLQVKQRTKTFGWLWGEIFME